MKSYKYLGATLDSELTLSKFADDINRKITNSIFKLANLRYMMDEQTAITIYKQTVLPFSDYCSFILDSASRQTVIDKIQVLQNQVLRICLRCKMRDETVKGLHLRCEISKLENGRKELLVSLMFRKSKILNTHSVVQTRSADKFNFPLKCSRSGFYAKSPYYRGVALWNELGGETQYLIKKESFKSRVKQHLNTHMRGKRNQYIKSREYINRQRRVRARNDILVNAQQ